MSATVEKKTVRAQWGKLLAGAFVGGLATFLFLQFIGERHMDLEDPSVMLATLAGLVYALMGLSVAIGIVAPGAGARFLNVEDAEELREEGPKLRTSAAACILMGAFLLLLALTKGGAMIGREVALAVLGVLLAGAVALTVISRKRTDELTRQIGLESSGLALQLALLGVAIWAALAQFGYVGWVSPLGLVSALALLQLFAIFIVAARKGVLVR